MVACSKLAWTVTMAPEPLRDPARTLALSPFWAPLKTMAPPPTLVEQRRPRFEPARGLTLGSLSGRK